MEAVFHVLWPFISPWETLACAIERTFFLRHVVNLHRLASRHLGIIWLGFRRAWIDNAGVLTLTRVGDRNFVELVVVLVQTLVVPARKKVSFGLIPR